MELLIAFSWIGMFGAGLWFGMRISFEDWRKTSDQGFESGYATAARHMREFTEEMETVVSNVLDPSE